MYAIHTTQVFSPFGGGYVPENHGPGPALGGLEEPSLSGWARILGALLVITSIAAAFTTTHGVAAGLN
jgi:hypothetical protein